MNTVAMNLEALNRADLYQLATTARINRRSTMNKAQLRAAIEALAEHDRDMYGALELHYALYFTPQDEATEPEAAPEAPADTATPERIALIHQLATETESHTGVYSELCDTFRREGMGNLAADTAAQALWARHLRGEFPRDTAEPEAAEPTVTVTLPSALCAILADTDALEGLHTVPGGARGSLRVTGTADQLTALTYDRLWVCAYNTSSEPHERAAYRRWIDALDSAGITL